MKPWWTCANGNGASARRTSSAEVDAEVALAEAVDALGGVGHPREAVNEVQRPLAARLADRRGLEQRRAAAEDPALQELAVERQRLLERAPEHVAAVAAHQRAPGGRRVGPLEVGVAEPGRVERLVEPLVGDPVAARRDPRAQAEVARCGRPAAAVAPTGGGWNSPGIRRRGDQVGASPAAAHGHHRRFRPARPAPEHLQQDREGEGLEAEHDQQQAEHPEVGERRSGGSRC